MIPLTRHLDLVREQPEPIKRQIALNAAGALTIVIALIWLGVSLGTGAFALGKTPFGGVAADTKAPTVSETVAGAAAALTTNKAAHIEIVTVGESSSLSDTKTDEPTILPF